MPIPFTELQQIVAREGLRFFLAPDRPVIQLGIGGVFGNYMLVIQLQDDGQFIQFRTVSYLQCPADHPYLGVVLQTMLTMNYEKRLVKFAWDKQDGEIVAYADMWLMDNALTQAQFSRMMHNFVPAIDIGWGRLKAVLETGSDPGNEGMQSLLAKLMP